MADKNYTFIESLLTNDEQKAEHKRIWREIKDTYKPIYLSAYLIYLQTFSNVHTLLKRDINAINPSDLYKYNNALNSIINQHNTAIKMLGFSPAHEKRTADKTGRKPKDTSLENLLG